MAGFMIWPTSAVVVFLFVVQCSIHRSVSDVTLSPCGDASDNTAEIVKGKTDITFTCSGLGSGRQVDWTVRHESVDNGAGTCPAGNGECQTGIFGSVFTPSMVSATESKLVVNPTALNDKGYFERGTLLCTDRINAGSCQMDYIVPVTGTCSIQTGTTESSRFQLEGSCSLQPGAQSARNRFRCQWNRSGGSWKVTVPLTQTTYQTGCRVTGQQLPTDNGRYTYTVTLFPGRQSVNAGTIDITRPAAPTVTGCGGDDFIPENTTVRCTCSTDNIGKPTGRLQWVKVGDSSVNKVGNYGEKSFTASQTLLRSDHQSSEFRCNVEWAMNILGASIKFNVGFPPSQVVLKINTHDRDVIVDEHQSVDFRCDNSNGRPNPTLSLVRLDNSSTLLSKTPSLSHVVVGRCEDSGQYVCTADNSMGPKFTGTPRSLFVKCSPRGSDDLGKVNFIDIPVSTTFDVTAYPVPNQVTFLYLGPAGNDTESPIDDTHIKLMGSCQAKSGTGTIHQATCNVTVNNVTSGTAAGFYRVVVKNDAGDGSFHLQVLYKAPPEPDPSEQEGTDVGPIVGGVIAAVVVIAVVIFVIIFIMKRRKDPASEKLGTSAGRHAPNGGHAGPVEGLDNPAHEHDPGLASASMPPIVPHSSSDVEAPAGGDMYAVVNKQKNPPAEGADVGAEAANDSTLGLYAEVDKTKKKKKKAAPPKPETDAKKAPVAKARKEKGKKGQKGVEEGHIYGNVEPTPNKRKKGKKPPALPMEETKDTGRQLNPEGLVYTSVDFSGAAATSFDPPRKDVLGDQGVLYSEVDFAKRADLEK